MEDVAVIVLGECMWGEEGGSALIYYTCTASIHIASFCLKMKTRISWLMVFLLFLSA